jgi:hypothetical protein
MRIPKVKGLSWLGSHLTWGGKQKFKDQRPGRCREKSAEPEKSKWKIKWLSQG